MTRRLPANGYNRPAPWRARMPRKSQQTVVRLEQDLLHALCNLSIGPAKWNELARELKDYRWRVPDHSVVYRALCATRSRDAKTWRHELPAQATRMGFPDIDWSPYVQHQQHLLAASKVRKMIGEITAKASSDE